MANHKGCEFRRLWAGARKHTGFAQIGFQAVEDELDAQVIAARAP